MRKKNLVVLLALEEYIGSSYVVPWGAGLGPPPPLTLTLCCGPQPVCQDWVVSPLNKVGLGGFPPVGGRENIYIIKLLLVPIILV